MSSSEDEDLFGEIENDTELGDGEVEVDGDGDAEGEGEEVAASPEEDGDGDDDDEGDGDGDADGDGDDDEDEGDADGNGDPDDGPASQSAGEDNDDDADGDEDDAGDDDEEEPPRKRTRSVTAPPRQAFTSGSSTPRLLHSTTRASLFPSILDPSQPNYALSLDPFVIINLTTPCHTLAATPCLTYLLAGCEDGYIRAYDFWASAQGKAVMTNAQKQTANLGDAVIKGGQSKGWWKNEVEVEVLEEESELTEEERKKKEKAEKEAEIEAEKQRKRKEKEQEAKQKNSAFGFLAPMAAPAVVVTPAVLPGNDVEKKRVRVRRLDPVYSMAVQSEGLWTVHGSSTGHISLTTLRHTPGKTVHIIGGGPGDHNKAISTLSLLPGEQGMITGSWDKTVKEWDLNTGKVVRTYTPHHAEISAVQLQPQSMQASSGPNGGLSVSISGDIFSPKKGSGASAVKDKDEDEDVEMKDAGAEDETKGVQAEQTPQNGKDSRASPAADSDEGSLFAFDEDEDRDAAGEPDDDTEMATEPPASAAVPAASATKDSSSTQTKEPSTASTADGQTNVRKRRRGGFAFMNKSAGGLAKLTPEEYNDFSSDIMMVASIDGEVAIHDRRIGQSKVGRLESGERTPPWCMSACWSSDGNQIIAGRQNATLDVWDVRRMGSSGTTSTPSLLKTLRNPIAAKEISAVAAFPDGRHIACAGNDCVRLWNTHDLWDAETSMKKRQSKVPFRIVAGHHGGMISQILIDPTGRFMLTASGNRGWQGETTRVILAHELKT